MQVKLLRVIQEHEIVRVGDTKPVKVNFRLITATNRNLEKMAKDGTYRGDLFFRFQNFRIVIPPLRERIEDIVPLAQSFAQKFGKKYQKLNISFDQAAINCLLSYEWPGNVRELESAIEYAVIDCRDSILTDNLPSNISEQSYIVSEYSLKEIERNHIKKVLVITKGNHRKTAKMLKISIPTLYRKLRLYNN